jgi:hypothetical protein
MKLKKDIGELVEVGSVLEAWGATAKRVRQKILSMPTKLAGEAVLITNINEMKTFLEKEIRDVLSELANTKEYKGN